MIDNFSAIPDLCHFTGDNFYKFFLMIRKKDVGEHPLITSKSQENIIKIWLVNSEEYLNKKIKEMKYLLKVIPNTRLYMCTDAKSNLKTIMTIRNNLNKVIDLLCSVVKKTLRLISPECCHHPRQLWRALNMILKNI